MRRKRNGTKAKKRFLCKTCRRTVPMSLAQKHIEKRCAPTKKDGTVNQ